MAKFVIIGEGSAVFRQLSSRYDGERRNRFYSAPRNSWMPAQHIWM